MAARSGCGFHCILDRLQDHAELPLQTRERLTRWDGEREALQDPGQEEEKLHFGQSLPQTNPEPGSERQVAG